MGDFRLLNFSTHPGTPPPRSHWCTGYSSAPLRTVALPSVRRGTGNPDDSNILLAVPRTALDRTGWPSRRTWRAIADVGHTVTSQLLGAVASQLYSSVTFFEGRRQTRAISTARTTYIPSGLRIDIWDTELYLPETHTEMGTTTMHTRGQSQTLFVSSTEKGHYKSHSSSSDPCSSFILCSFLYV